jgi:hypothetical protein
MRRAFDCFGSHRGPPRLGRQAPALEPAAHAGGIGTAGLVREGDRRLIGPVPTKSCPDSRFVLVPLLIGESSGTLVSRNTGSVSERLR